MTKIISATVIEAEGLTLEELCQLLHLEDEIILKMIDHELFTPRGNKPQNWRFDSICIKRARIAVSFYQDLKINMPGIALALDLLNRIDDLEKQIDMLEKHF